MTMMKKTAPHGFSLVEVALAMAILAVGMTGVLALLPVGLEAARQVHAETAVAQVVRLKIADLWLSNQGKASFLDGSTLPSQTFTAEGVLTNSNAASAYFRIEMAKDTATETPDSCRYYLTLRWPVRATLEKNQQKRVFVTEVVKTP